MDMRNLINICEGEFDVVQKSQNLQQISLPLRDYKEFKGLVDEVNTKAGEEIVKLTNINKHTDSEGNTSVIFDLETVRNFIEGFTFVARIDHTMGNMVTLAPGATLSDEKVQKYYNASSHVCDVCKTKRNRNNTYVILDDTKGEPIQVGSDCLKPFMGGKNPKLVELVFTLLRSLTRIQEYSDGEEREFGDSPEFDIDDCLAAAVCAINKFGYSKSESESPTKVAMNLILTRDKNSPKVSQGDYDKAKEIIKWIESIPEEKVNNDNFLRNLSLIAKNKGDVKDKHYGFIAYMPIAYIKSQEDVEKKKEQQAAGALSQYVGTVGAKIPKTTVEVVFTRLIDGQYGTTQMVKMKDDNGNIYTWFNSGGNRLELGSKYSIVGSIKKHDEYKGEKSTVLTRVKGDLVESVLSVDLSSLMEEFLTK